jgi:hypothetical protein
MLRGRGRNSRKRTGRRREHCLLAAAALALTQVVLSGFAPTELATAGTVTFDGVGLFAR